MEVYRARWLLPVAGDPVENGAIAVDRGRVTDVGKASTLRGDSVQDLGDCILLPGFVNAHTHLELSCYRGCVAPKPLWEWFDELIVMRLRAEAAAEEREAVRLGAAESLAAGVTCVGDISRMGIQVDVLQASPIRKVCFLELISGAHVPPHDAASLASALDRASAFAEPQRLILGVSPHALYTVTWDDLVGAGTLAAEHKAPLTIHLLETADEAPWLATGSGRLQEQLSKYRLPTASQGLRGRAIELLQQTGIAGQRPLLAHVNYIDDRELQSLAASGAAVVWCPRSHRFFGHGPHRWREMLAAGINVCIGTDSLASNDTLSILDELRFVRRTVSDVPLDTILEMGTLRGAMALSMERHVGSLQIGKCADFMAVPWDRAGSGNPILNLLDGDRPVCGTWIGGVDVTRQGG